jgi:hypothetical protein
MDEEEIGHRVKEAMIQDTLHLGEVHAEIKMTLVGVNG